MKAGSAEISWGSADFQATSAEIWEGSAESTGPCAKFFLVFDSVGGGRSAARSNVWVRAEWLGVSGIRCTGRRFSETRRIAMSNETKDGSQTIPDELIDQLLRGHQKPEDLTGPNGLIKQLVSKLVTRAMSAELDHHLGYEPGQAPPEGQSN